MLAKSPRPARRARLFSWLAVAAVLLLIQTALSLAVPKSGFITNFLVLVLAAGIATLNAVHNREAIRLFWSFLAMAFGVWSLNACSWIYYALVQRRERAVYLFVAVPLFLHIVLIIAAVVSRPHLKLSSRRGYQATLNFLLLLFFWVFVYALLLVPYSYTHWADAALTLRGQAIYVAENLLLLAVLGVFILQTQPPWKSIYWHLFGASSLYLLGSTIATIHFAFRGLSGSLWPSTMAPACWFVWVTLRGRKLAPQLAQAVKPGSGDTRYASLLAMLVVVTVPVVGVWELFRADEPYRTRVIRLLIVLLSVLILAVFAFVKEYLANRELSSDVGLANDRLRLAMESGKAVGWEWEIASGRNLWFGNLKSMFGIRSESFVASPEDFDRYIYPQDRQQVSEGLDNAKTSRRPYMRQTTMIRGTVSSPASSAAPSKRVFRTVLAKAGG